jgi:hypothetical protein
MHFPGTPSDQVAEVVATGRGDITTAFVSMARRHPDGTDADSLRWHTLDHRHGPSAAADSTPSIT